jgi:hypothetical protein
MIISFWMSARNNASYPDDVVGAEYGPDTNQ